MNLVSLAAGTVPELGPFATVRAAAAGGFDAAGLWVDPAQRTPRILRDATHSRLERRT